MNIFRRGFKGLEGERFDILRRYRPTCPVSSQVVLKKPSLELFRKPNNLFSSETIFNQRLSPQLKKRKTLNALPFRGESQLISTRLSWNRSSTFHYDSGQNYIKITDRGMISTLVLTRRNGKTLLTKISNNKLSPPQAELF